MSNLIHQLNYGSRVIEYHLTFTNRKSLGIRVLPDGTVHAIAPIGANLIDVQEKIKSKANWILKQQRFFNSYKPSTPERKYVNGETHLYLGRQYKLNINHSQVKEVKIRRNEMIVLLPKSNPIAAQKTIGEWYKLKADIVFKQSLDKVLPLFDSYTIETPYLEIRQMEKRWGSCSKSGKITLNTALIKAPKGCIDYVVIHELCHLVYYNHTKDFYNLLYKLCPDWEKWKQKLEQMLV